MQTTLLMNVKKSRLFLGHRARCLNKNIPIRKLEERLKVACMNNRMNKDITAIMIGDFKMKYEPLSSRESTLDHYGKQGISWLALCLSYLLLTITPF